MLLLDGITGIENIYEWSDFLSAYSFIASDYELLLLDNSKEKVITVAEVMLIDEESDLGELVIGKSFIDKENVRWYTNKPYIYPVEFEYSESRAEQLLEYLKTNIHKGHQLELWLIWLDDKQSIKPIICSYKDISLYHIKQMYDRENENFENYSCIIIKR